MIDLRPDPGMTNLEWARKIREQIDSLPVDQAEQELEKVLTFACVYSERPADRFSKEHIHPGHLVVAWKIKERPGYIVASCQRCNEEAEVEIDANATLVMLLKHMGALSLEPFETIICETTKDPHAGTPEEN